MYPLEKMPIYYNLYTRETDGAYRLIAQLKTILEERQKEDAYSEAEWLQIIEG